MLRKVSVNFPSESIAWAQAVSGIELSCIDGVANVRKQSAGA